MNEAFREAAKGAQAGILAVVDEPLVSVDFRCTDVSTSIDSSLTMVMGARGFQFQLRSDCERWSWDRSS